MKRKEPATNWNLLTYNHAKFDDTWRNYTHIYMNHVYIAYKEVRKSSDRTKS